MDAISAIQNGNVKELQEMVKQVNQGWSFFHTSALGVPLLHYAVQSKKNSIEMINTLLDNDIIEIDCKDSHTGATALHWSCEWNNIPATRLLLSKCKDLLNIQDHSGESPLHWACLKGNSEVIHALISEYGNDIQINMKNDDGNTPLHNAAINNNIECIALLLKANADKKILNNQKKKPRELLTDQKIVQLFDNNEYLEKFHKDLDDEKQKNLQKTENLFQKIHENKNEENHISEIDLRQSTDKIQNLDWENQRNEYVNEIERLKKLLQENESSQGLKKQLEELKQEFKFTEEELNEASLENLRLKQELRNYEDSGNSNSQFFPNVDLEKEKQINQEYLQKIKTLETQNMNLVEEIKRLSDNVNINSSTPSTPVPIDHTLEEENKKYILELEQTIKSLEQEYHNFKENSQKYNMELEEKLKKYEQKDLLEKQNKDKDSNNNNNTNPENLKYIQTLEIKVKSLSKEIQELKNQNEDNLDLFEKISQLIKNPLSKKQETN